MRPGRVRSSRRRSRAPQLRPSRHRLIPTGPRGFFAQRPSALCSLARRHQFSLALGRVRPICLRPSYGRPGRRKPLACVTACDLSVYCALTGKGGARIGGYFFVLFRPRGPPNTYVPNKATNFGTYVPRGRGSLLACQVSHAAPGRPEFSPSAPVPWLGRLRSGSSSMQLPHLVGQVPGTPHNCGSVAGCKTWWLLWRPGGQDWPTSENSG